VARLLRKLRRQRPSWWGCVQVKSRRPIALESAWFQTFKLKFEILVSNFAFQILNLYRYSLARRGGGGDALRARRGAARAAVRRPRHRRRRRRRDSNCRPCPRGVPREDARAGAAGPPHAPSAEPIEVIAVVAAAAVVVVVDRRGVRRQVRRARRRRQGLITCRQSSTFLSLVSAAYW
jgi:hypothetical protein